MPRNHGRQEALTTHADMSWVESVFAGVIAGLFGVIVASVVAYAAFGWFPFTGLEGARGYFIVLNAVAGGIVAFVIGLIVARAWNRWARPQWKAVTSTAHVAGGASILVLAIGIGTALLLWLLADIPPEIDGRQLNLEVEFRLPSTDTTPPAEIVNPQFSLASVTDRVKRNERAGVLMVEQARKDETDRWIIPAQVLLYTTRGQRLVEAHLGGDMIGSFTIPLPGRPGPEHQKWSDWLPRPAPAAKGGSTKGASKAAKGDKAEKADKTDTPDKTDKSAKAAAPAPAAASTAKGAPAAGKGLPLSDVPGYRFRVVRVGAPQPDTAKQAARAAAASKTAAAAAVGPKPDSSVAELLGHTRLSATDAERDAAIQALTARPDYVEQLSALMLDDDNRIAADAMYVVSKLPKPPANLAPGVIAAGKDLAARLDRLNESTATAKEQFPAASDITIRFAAWMDAVRVLRRSAGVDFMPYLVAILERSRVRTDNTMVQHDIRRVASRFAKEWGGIAPAPGDPPW